MVLIAVLSGCSGGDKDGPPVPTTQVTVPPKPTVPERDPCDPLQTGTGDYVVSETENLCLSFNSIDGNLTIDADPSSVECLCHVGGTITIAEARGSLSLPHLTDIGGGLVSIAQTGMSAILMPELLSIGGPVQIEDNDQLFKVG